MTNEINDLQAMHARNEFIISKLFYAELHKTLYKTAIYKYNGNAKNRDNLSELLESNTVEQQKEIEALLSLDCDKYFKRVTGDKNADYKDTTNKTKVLLESYYPFTTDTANYKESKENPFSFYSCVSDTIVQSDITETKKINTPYINEYTPEEKILRKSAMQKENLEDRTAEFKEIGKSYNARITTRAKIIKFFDIEDIVLTKNKKVRTRIVKRAPKLTLAKVLSRASATARREALSFNKAVVYVQKEIKKQNIGKIVDRKYIEKALAKKGYK